MAWDLMRGVDLLLRPAWNRPCARIVPLGAVAGGGDPAAVTCGARLGVSQLPSSTSGRLQPETIFPLRRGCREILQLLRRRKLGIDVNLRLSRAARRFCTMGHRGPGCPAAAGLRSSTSLWDQELTESVRWLQTIFGFYEPREKNYCRLTNL